MPKKKIENSAMRKSTANRTFRYMRDSHAIRAKTRKMKREKTREKREESKLVNS